MNLIIKLFKQSKLQIFFLLFFILILSALLYFRLPKLSDIQIFDNEGSVVSSYNITNKSIGKEPYRLLANLDINDLSSNRFRIFGDDCINSLKVNNKVFDLPLDQYDNKDCFKTSDDFVIDNLQIGRNQVEAEIGDKGGWYFGFGINNSVKDPIFATNFYTLGISCFIFLILLTKCFFKSKVWKYLKGYTNYILKNKSPKAKIGFVILCLIIILILGFNIRSPELVKQGYGYDMGLFKMWGEETMNNGVVSLYGKVNIDYPPLYPVQLSLAQNIWTNILHNDPKSEDFTKMIKYMNLGIDFLISILIFFYLKDKSKKLAVFAAALYFFNPAIIYDTAIWGQIDVMIFLYLILVLFGFKYHKLKLVPFFTLLGLLTKTQFIIFVPIIGISWLVEVMKVNQFENYNLYFPIKNKLKIILSIILKFLLPTLVLLFSVLFLFLIQGKPDEFVKIYSTAAGRYPYLTLNSYNLWWLAQGNNYIWELNPSTKVIIPQINLTAKNVGLIAFVIIYLLMILRIIRNKNDDLSLKLIEAGIFVISIAFFVLNTEMHERYLITAIPMSILMLKQSKRYLPIYLVLTLTNYIMMSFTMSYDPSFENMKNLWFGAVTNLVSILNIAVLILVLVWEVKLKFSKKEIV